MKYYQTNAMYKTSEQCNKFAPAFTGAVLGATVGVFLGAAIAGAFNYKPSKLEEIINH